MVHKALDSFVKTDPDMARSVLVSDDIVDKLQNSALAELTDFMKNNPVKRAAMCVLDVRAAQSRADRRSCHEYRGRRYLSGRRCRCSSSLRSNKLDL